jgi:hypothetical protein
MVDYDYRNEIEFLKREVASLRARGHRRRRVLFLAVGTALALCTGGAVYASIPDPQGVIHGCLAGGSGGTKLLLVIDTAVQATCLSGQTPIVWNQTGPQGVQGPQGQQGVQGSQGPQGPAGITNLVKRTGGVVAIPHTLVGSRTVATITLPQGTWYLLGVAHVASTEYGKLLLAACGIDQAGAGTVVDPSASALAVSYNHPLSDQLLAADLTLPSVVSVGPNGGTFNLTCGTGAGDILSSHSSLTALQVTNADVG